MMKQRSFYVSYGLQHVCSVGMIQMSKAWNNHIARKGIPNAHYASNCINPIHSLEVPTGDDAIEEFRRQGASTTDPHEFGVDPLAGNTRNVNKCRSIS